MVEIASNNASFNNISVAQRFMEVDDLFNQTITKPTLQRYYMIYEELDLLYIRVYTQLELKTIEEVTKIRKDFLKLYIAILNDAMADEEDERKNPTLAQMMTVRTLMKQYYALINEGLQKLGYFFTTKGGEKVTSTYKDSGLGEDLL